MRFRYALIAILVAIAAVAVGAQASTGSSPATSDDGNPANGTLFRHGPARPHGKLTRIAPPRTTRVSGGSDSPATPASFENIMNNQSACRYPNGCFFSGDNIGALTDPGEPTLCNATNYGSSVWFETRAHHQGILDFFVDGSTATYPGNPGNFFAAVTITGVRNNFSNYLCGFASHATQIFDGSGFIMGTNEYDEFGVGSENDTPEGEFDFVLSWDPDTDGDGGVDSADNCPTQRGPASLGYCPDSDGDGIRDRDDNCPTQKGARGPAGVNGCPDTDGDGFRDKQDACPRESVRGRTDRNVNGCPDFTALPDLSRDGNGYINRRLNLVVGFKFKTLKFKSKLPKGTRVKIRCKPRRACRIRKRGSLKKRLGRVHFSKNKRKRKQKIKITITAKKFGYVSKVFSFSVGFKRNSSGGRDAFITSLKKRCIPATGGRSQKCSSSMLLR